MSRDGSFKPYLRRGATLMPIGWLLRPRQPGSPPQEFQNGTLLIALEPGSYSICPALQSDCLATNIIPGAEAAIPLPKRDEGEPHAPSR
jgi:hypothetical protein